MWNLSEHERLEMEILNGLNARKILNNLIFCGGTMLRLCHELNRYSVDLDFWIIDQSKTEHVFKDTKRCLEENFKVKTASNKYALVFFEFSSKDYPRNLRIEIRQEKRNVKHEEKIAFSRHSTLQVLVKSATLEEMMKSKIETFLDRLQIKDVFDIEFLVRRGIKITATLNQLGEMERLIRKFKLKDYKVTLGALLEFKERQYYKSANFRHLLSHIKAEQAATLE